MTPSGCITISGRYAIRGCEDVLCLAAIVGLDDITLHPLVKARSPETGTPVTCYLDDLGPVDGIVAAMRPGGFALDLVASDERRARTAARLAWLRRAGERQDQRAAARIVPIQRDVCLRLSPGLETQVTVADLSMTGAALALPEGERPEVGSLVTVGKRFARVIRHTPDGIGVAFRLPFGPMTFNERVII